MASGGRQHNSCTPKSHSQLAFIDDSAYVDVSKSARRVPGGWELAAFFYQFDIRLQYEAILLKEYVVSMKKVQSKDLKSGRLIGKGPSSVVYETTLAGKRYARKDFLRVPSDIFEKEAAALIGLDHPSVVRTFCWAVDEGSCSLVVELMDDDLLNLMQTRMDSQRKNSQSSGSATQRSHVIDLYKFLEVRKSVTGDTASESVAMPFFNPFTVPEVLQIMLQVAEGVKFLHDKGVAHGDLKPKNILVTSNGKVSSSSFDENVAFKVADFGLFWTKMKSRTLVSRRASNLELARWRAPELLELAGLREDEHESSTDSDWDSDSSDETIGELPQKLTFKDMARADIYNFAITCSQILTGEDPYPELSLNDLVRRILGGLRPGLPPTCPARLRALLERCWGEKTERPSFEGLFAELKDLQASLTRSDAVVNYKSSMTESSSSRIDSFELEVVPENSAASGQAVGGPESSSAREIHQKVDVPIGHEEHSIKDIQADSSKGTLVPKQRRMNGKALGISSFLRKMMSMSNVKVERKGISTPTKFYGDKRKRRPPDLKVLHRFSSSDIKRMTNDFNEENIIGREGRYTVYKGIQAGTGATVAVMRLRFDFEGDFEAFKMEIEMVSQVYHKYVVALVGYYQKHDPILIYEYPDNGSLFDHLHGTSAKVSTLNWRMRLHIALNAAQGLEYLHTGCSPSIIHRNVKSTNILLTPEFDAKVADFELAKLMSETEDTVRVMTDVMGTLGYLDPEYYKTHCVSTKSDVYSFGIVLLELITGSLPIDLSMLNVGRNPCITHWVLKRLQINDIDSILAPVVKASIPNMEAVWKVVEVAMQSIELRAVHRPTMTEVVRELRHALTIEVGSIT